MKLLIYPPTNRKLFKIYFRGVIEKAQLLKVDTISLYQSFFPNKLYFSWFSGDVLSFGFKNSIGIITSYGVNHIHLWSQKSKKRLFVVNDIFYGNDFARFIGDYIKTDNELQLLFDNTHPLYFMEVIFSSVWILSICNKYYDPILTTPLDSMCLQKEVLLSFDLITASHEALLKMSTTFKDFL